MKTINEIQESITNITAKIQREFPELNKYILEMPQNNTDTEEVTIKCLTDYYLSLEDIVSEYSKTHSQKTHYADQQIYPPSEDIYVQFKEETEINPEDITKKKIIDETTGGNTVKMSEEYRLGGDLDVPGSELDDQQESVGSEDEENNYYSLGGDNHNDLEEDNG
ncbi:hypothetical protein ACFSX9_03840 [Flavobacterium ardleyense]|uniref:Uncharacterized protein n=1 Tax=Flavobacterium ardleyense TaxID=2038737 RepID=A0ABW5Z6B8_9FLAO